MSTLAASEISFVVPCVPVAQPRQRHRIIAGRHGSYVHNYTPTKAPVNQFKASLQMAARQAYDGPPLNGPIWLEIVAVFPRPQSMLWKKRPMPRVRHTKKPDRDNVEKAVKDALSGIVWRDDSQVCDGPTSKWIAAGDEAPHVVVTVRLLELDAGPQSPRAESRHDECVGLFR